MKQKINRYILLFLTAILFVVPTYSQEPCGLEKAMESFYISNPEYNPSINVTRSTCPSNNAPYEIPVVFHVLHNNGSENITDEQIKIALSQANKQFAGLHGGFDTQISFYLAQVDPNGYCSSGINRIQTSSPGISVLNFNNDKIMKNLIRWPVSRYLNIWIVDFIEPGSGIVGYSYVPPTSLYIDGVVVLHDFLGNSGTAVGTNTNTLTHELGHYLGLKHLWGKESFMPGEDICVINCDDIDCENSGDYVCDTDPLKSIHLVSTDFNCETIIPSDCESCADFPKGQYFYETDNYMGYVDHCQDKFTEGQAHRMWCIIEDFRANLPFEFENSCVSDCRTIVTSSINASNGQIFPGNIIIQNGGVLRIKEDYVVFMGQDKSITIETGGHLILEENADILPCDTYWNKIDVYGRLTTEGDDNQLISLRNGIIAHPNSYLELNEVTISGTNPNVPSTGLFVNGSINTTSLYNLRINNYFYGIQNLNNQSYHNFNSGQITGCRIGIYINKAPSRINNYIISVNEEAINAISSPGMLIENNKLNANPSGDTKGLNMWFCDASVIRNNQIGAIVTPNTGISLYLSNGGSIRNNSSVKGSTTGIFAFNTDFNILNNTIGVSSSANLNRGALTLLNGNSNQILNNYINSTNVTFGINTKMCKGIQIENNSVSTSFSATFQRAAAIKSEGCNDENIENNIVTATGNSDGIIAVNTAGNTYDCNAVSVGSLKDALSVFYNSQGQSLKGNTLSGSSRDLVIRSTIGNQLHQGNKFLGGNVIAETQIIANGSIFRVNSTYLNHLPANSNPSNWFINEPNFHKYYECASTPGPSLMPLWEEESVLCAFYEAIVRIDGYNSNAYKRVIQTMLRYEQDNEGYTLPHCIKNDPYLPSCWNTLVQAENLLKYEDMSKESSRSALAQKIDGLSSAFGAGTEVNFLLSQRASMTSLITSLSYVKEEYASKISSAKIMLNGISCADPIMNVARNILIEYVGYLESADKSAFNYNPLITYSRLCADEYGPYVHLARAVVYPVTGEYFDQYDNCTSAITPRSSDQNSNLTSIYPNPSNGSMSIDLGEEKSGTINVFDANGRLLTSKDYNKSKTIVLNLSDYNGMTFVQIIDHNGLIEVIKHFIIE